MHIAASVTYTSESKKRERTKLKRFRFALTLGRSAATGENAQRSTYTPGRATRGHGCSIPSAAPDLRGLCSGSGRGYSFPARPTTRSSFALTFLQLPICMTSSIRKARGNGRLQASSTHRCKAPLSRRRGNRCGSTPPSSRCSSRPKARPSTQNLQRRERHAVAAAEKVTRVWQGGCQGYTGSESATTIFRHLWTHGQCLTTLSQPSDRESARGH